MVKSEEITENKKIKKAYTGDGKIINSEFLNSLSVEQAKEKKIKEIERKKIGNKKISFRLKDWGISRQRYWGCPIPMIYLEDGSIVPDNQAYIFRNSKGNLQSDNNVYPSNGPLKIPSNALGFIMFGLQYEFTDYNDVSSYLKGFDPNEPPTGTEHGAVHYSEQLPPQFFTFAVRLDGSLFKEAVDSRYYHLYNSIDFDLTEDEKNLSIKSIKLSESLYKITSIGEKYTEYLAQAFIENDLS